jgi:hypothetical protein
LQSLKDNSRKIKEKSIKKEKPCRNAGLFVWFFHLPTPPTKQNQNKKVPKSEVQKKVKGAREKERGTRKKVKGKSAVEVGSPKSEVGSPK